MKTCRKIVTQNGPLFRGGGLCILQENTRKMGILTEIYKTQFDVFAVIEILVDATARKGDSFLFEANMKVWKRTNNFFILSNLSQLESVPLLHACSAEDLPLCDFKRELVDVIEERQCVRKEKRYYNCSGRNGTYFLVNSLAFSIPHWYEV